MGTVPFALILLCAILTNKIKAADPKKSSENNNVFVPTHKWQIVKPGQKVPKGLHVRINFQTGVTEAKLLDATEQSDKSTAIVIERSSNDDGPRISQAELEEALKNIENEDTEDEYDIEMRKQFKSYEELKKDLKELHISPKSDTEILKELIVQHIEAFKNQATEDYMLTILEDLEYLVHQIDNAENFVNLNGFQDVIYPALNSTNVKIKEGALNIFGACVQNNANVQIHALETGAVGTLLKVLVLNSDRNVKNRAIFALGCLLRRFPLAQLRFVENVGINIFIDLLGKSNDLKIQLKIVTLINDLILEHQYTLLDSKRVNNSEKLVQYNKIDLKNKLREHSWCSHLAKLLINVVSVDSSDHDSIEKALIALDSMTGCSLDDKSSLIEVLVRLKIQYANLSVAKESDDDSYFEHLSNLCNNVLRLINHNVKTEL